MTKKIIEKKIKEFDEDIEFIKTKVIKVQSEIFNLRSDLRKIENPENRKAALRIIEDRQIEMSSYEDEINGLKKLQQPFRHTLQHVEATEAEIKFLKDSSRSNKKMLIEGYQKNIEIALSGLEDK